MMGTSFPLSLLMCLLLFSITSVKATQSKYVGVHEVCGKCHHVQYISWEKRPHAKAFEALKPGERIEVKRAAGLRPMQDYTEDGKCLKCHTTGYGKPGGFVSLERTPAMANVQCESCHGAGGDYVEEIMRRKFSFAHAEIDDLGHVGYAVRSHAHSTKEEISARPADAHKPSHPMETHTHYEEHRQADKYGYDALGDPPPRAHRHQGEIHPLDPAKASRCTETCHNEASPTYKVSGIEDFVATFSKQVKKGVHRRYGLMFIHW
ncbi:MAG: cytochrome c family protein [Dehalococcoidia bacterium]